ncbi:LOW QUALITY PROTEIN: hypothetical protein RJ640_029028 [Escallonia rubra]|uniref:DUF4283 domain-containing protein n=1 Tax=Escallonia rubra TaxID=112253 RepID=A0AA88SA94_9ASTE|nr:LOW QUALITY PROTEIN: hypothetical protein RJ640_029028 [Escallonia rubra]
MIESSLLRLLKWTPAFNQRTESASAAVWVRLPGLPLPLFNPASLNKEIADQFGRFLRADIRTLELSHPVFARFCMEVDTSDLRPPSRIWITIGNGHGYWQKIVYEGKSYCQHLRLHGHSATEYRKVKGRVTVHPNAKEETNKGKTSMEDKPGDDKPKIRWKNLQPRQARKGNKEKEVTTFEDVPLDGKVEKQQQDSDSESVEEIYVEANANDKENPLNASARSEEVLSVSNGDKEKELKAPSAHSFHSPEPSATIPSNKSPHQTLQNKDELPLKDLQENFESPRGTYY